MSADGDQGNPAGQLIERLLADGQALIEDLAMSSSFIDLVGRLETVDREDLKLIAIWVVVRELSVTAAKGASGEVAPSEEVAQEELRAWLVADDLLAKFALIDPDAEPSPRGRSPRGGKKSKKRRRRS